MLDDKEYLRWINTAKKNIESAYKDLEHGDYNWACFKAQQAGEAAVKALLHGIGVSAYGHSISKLLHSLKEIGLSVSDPLINYAKILDKYYIPTRYPNAWAEGSPHEYYTRDDGLKAIKSAEEIINWVEDTWRLLKQEEG